MKSVVVGNWKMNGDSAYLARVLRLDFHPDATVVICPPATLLSEARTAIRDAKKSLPQKSHSQKSLSQKSLFQKSLFLGGQDCHYASAGSHTGDISAAMLKAAGADYVIVGHSERRGAYQETGNAVRKKAIAAFKNDVIPIICVGETLREKESGLTGAVLKTQIENSVPVDFPEKPFLIAYEPVWAIGSGKTPSENDISLTLEEIRLTLLTRLSAEKAQNVPLLYGGSVNLENIERLAAIETLNGVLLGGSSLDANAFNAIVRMVAIHTKN